MSDIQNLCKQANDRIFQYQVLHVVNGELKVLPTITSKLAKKLYFDDLITYNGSTVVFTERLKQYLTELSK